MTTPSDSIVIRDAGLDDMAALQAIYAPHVNDGLASFEETPPDVDEMTRRFQSLKEDGYPYRVAEVEGVIRGYAYAGKYRPRAAYRTTVENSIYVDVTAYRMGIGRRLLEDLIEQCEALGYRRMVAVIGDSDNHGSINLHARCGFEDVGVIPSIAFKHGRWLDQVLMQRSLGEGDETDP